MRNRLYILMMSLTLFTACSSNKHVWEDIDYSRVRSTNRENDSSYTAPSVLNCVDDDLYNCNIR